MDKTQFHGRWREEPLAASRGDLVWIEPKSGLQTHVATVLGRQVATIRKAANTQERVVCVPGWVWSQPLAESAAAKLGIGETEVKGFTDLRAAKYAVEYALKCLPCAETK
jgi:hypothetical protein